MRAVAVTIVDNADIARVKTVPVTGLEQAIRCGVGLSPVYAVATVDESFTASKAVGGPSGDLRLMPDPAALRAVAAQPRWAWAPTDQYTQDGQVSGCCQRSFAARMAAMAACAAWRSGWAARSNGSWAATRSAPASTRGMRP